MIRYLTWAAKHSTKVPRLASEAMIPDSKGQLSHKDLVRMYDLRMYHISTVPDNRGGDEYVPELEMLHNELNFRSVQSTFSRALLFFAVAGGIVIFFMDESIDNLNWNNKWNLQHQMGILAELDEGGAEGDEPPNL